jgi:hypothetical protein
MSEQGQEKYTDDDGCCTLDVDHEQCERCGCCELIYEECENCGGEGYIGHDCGEDTCACLAPFDNIPCDVCDGVGAVEQCLGSCDAKGRHKKRRLKLVK